MQDEFTDIMLKFDPRLLLKQLSFFWEISAHFKSKEIKNM